MFRWIAAFSLLLGSALPVAADPICEELWLVRNMVFSRAGYCFQSQLGQAVFDNSVCAAEVNLSPEDEEVVAAVQEMEGYNDCAINTATSVIPPTMAELLPVYRLLHRLPVRADGESACIGYRGPARSLRTAPESDAGIVGILPTGSTIGYLHHPVNDWNYVVIYDGPSGALLTQGWLAPMPVDETVCEMLAG